MGRSRSRSRLGLKIKCLGLVPEGLVYKPIYTAVCFIAKLHVHRFECRASILFTDSQVKMTDCVHHRERRKAAEHLATCHPHALHLPSLSQYWSLCQNGSCFHQVWSESQWTVLLRYLINTSLSRQMLDAIKHIVDNSIVFQQDTAPVCNQQGLYHLGVRCHRNVGQ